MGIDILSRFEMMHLYTALAFVVIFFSLNLIKRFFIHQIKVFTSKTKSDFDDILITKLSRIGQTFYIALDILILSKYLQFYDYQTFSSQTHRIADNISLVIIVIYLSNLFNTIILYFLQKYIQSQNKSGSKIDISILDIVDIFLKIFIWSFAFIFTLQTLGMNVTALITGLGVGGIAIAFALQNVLTDIFASIAIYLDKPFASGHYIQYGNTVGKVKKIGIKSTRIETLDGEEHIISNKSLTDTDIANYTKLKKRRVLINIGLTYDTERAKIQKIPDILKKITTKYPIVEFKRAHFTGFGSYSLDFELVYYIKSSDFNLYMDTKQAINLDILSQFEKLGVQMAFPTQNIVIEKQNNL